MNLLQKIFRKKSNGTQPIVSGTFAKISDVLNDRQKEGVFLFYQKHKERIDRLVNETEKAYEPSEAEDKNNPMIWKNEYWKWWILANCH